MAKKSSSSDKIETRKAETDPEAVVVNKPSANNKTIEIEATSDADVNTDGDPTVCVVNNNTSQPSISSTTVLDSDFVRVSASESVPQTILASQDR